MKLSCSLVFYIGNGVVKAAITTIERNKEPRMLATRVRELPHFNERDRAHLENRILFEFGELVHDFKVDDITSLQMNNVTISIKNALVILSSPWYISETSVIKLREQKPFVVTDTLLSGYKENIVKAYRDAHKVDVAILEQKIIHILLNGYPTNNPIKKKTQTLDMTVFTSFARNSSITKIKDIIDSNFHVHDIALHSQSLVSFSVISNTWHDITQYIIADITSELTELVTVRKGTLAEASTFPKGKRFLVKTISDELQVSTEVAESLLKIKNEGKLESDLESKVLHALEVAKKEWLKNFSESLAVASASTSLPSTFFLFAPKDVVSIFSEYIQCDEYQQFSFAEGKFKVKRIEVSDLLPYCKIATGATGDLSLMVASIFNNTLLK